jgi:hypothetical protein
LITETYNVNDKFTYNVYGKFKGILEPGQKSRERVGVKKIVFERFVIILRSPKLFLKNT